MVRFTPAECVYIQNVMSLIYVTRYVMIYKMTGELTSNWFSTDKQCEVGPTTVYQVWLGLNISKYLHNSIQSKLSSIL